MKTLIGLCVASCLLAGTAAIAESRYGSWQDGGAETQALVDWLRELTVDAEKAGAADRRFIADLWDLIGEYDNPWTEEIVSDGFRDGDHTPGGAFELKWTRRSDGTMSVIVNGNQPFGVTGRTWEKGLQGLSLTNLQGHFAVRRATLLGGRS